jgi:FKBP12-rapamycin complex-associated protein
MVTKVSALKFTVERGLADKKGELKEALWSRSPNAEIWIKRRTNFARTIGVGSESRLSTRSGLVYGDTEYAGFVGHVIGLGDRHGCNILVDQLTWGALHIDFGDVSHPNFFSL